MEISLVPTEHVKFVWPEVEPLLVKALERTPGRFTGDDLLLLLSERAQDLWIAFEPNGDILSAFTTRLYDVSSGRVCSIEWVGGGDLSKWIDQAIDTLERYAKDLGCTIIEGHGRTGWLKLLENHGWTKFSVSYQKVLI